MGKKKRKKPGSPPGTLVYTGAERMDKAQMQGFAYDETYVHTFSHFEEANLHQGKIWLDVLGVHDETLIEEIGKFYKLHPLLLEDVLNPDQRPKLDQYPDCLFFVFKSLQLNANNILESEQISLVIMHNVVISFQENKSDTLQPIRERLDNPQARMRKLGSSYLAYAIVDAIFDHYFIVLDEIGERMEQLEEAVQNSNSPSDIKHQMHALKRSINHIRKNIFPLREAVMRIVRLENSILEEAVKLYWADLLDHLTSALEMAETYQGMALDLQDLYNAEQNNRLNQAMRVLTVISTIFMPLSFLAAIYGMNFEWMPELKSPLGYPLFWLFSFLLTIGLIWFFKRKHWL